MTEEISRKFVLFCVDNEIVLPSRIGDYIYQFANIATAELEAQNIKDCENFNKKMKEIKEQWNKEHCQLSKARELLKQWVELFKPKGGNIPPTPVQVDTEQFLKEVEE